MTKYFYDTEFLEDGSTIDLISIAFVSEDGREYYAVNADMDLARVMDDPWLVKNVVAQLPDATTWKPKEVIAKEVLEFLRADGEEPELWAWYSAYDHVSYAQLWGKMIHLPNGLPMFTHDLRSLLDWALPYEQHYDLPKQGGGVHDALADARHLKIRYEWVIRQKALNDLEPTVNFDTGKVVILTEEDLNALPVGSIVRFVYTGNVARKLALGDWQVAGFDKNYEAKALVNSKEGVHFIWKPNALTKRTQL